MFQVRVSFAARTGVSGAPTSPHLHQRRGEKPQEVTNSAVASSGCHFTLIYIGEGVCGRVAAVEHLAAQTMFHDLCEPPQLSRDVI